jgi:predicted nucleic acid-binding protein
MEIAAPEVLLCDTSYIGHFERSLRDAGRYRHWCADVLDRIAAAVLAITPFTQGEIRAGYIIRGWGAARIAQMNNRLSGYVLIPLDADALDEYARLKAACRSGGVSLSDNDLWIAAISISQNIELVTCDAQQARLPGVRSIYLSPP